jgi:hypothetical protein
MLPLLLMQVLWLAILIALLLATVMIAYSCMN